jgi:shikimate dehydrogenase
MTAPDQYAVMGHPIAHSRSPQIHALFAAQCGQDLQYTRLDVPPERFSAAVAGFFAAGGKGLNITIPHKRSAFRLVQRHQASAEAAGTVNTVWQDPDGALCGANTDGIGLVRDLTVNLGLSVTGKRLLMLGAGGAARGVLLPLLQLNPACVVVLNRTNARADELAAAFAARGPVRSSTVVRLANDEPYDLVINATAASLSHDLPVLPANAINQHTFCYDMAYGGGSTVFTRWAHAEGAGGAAMGLGMLVEQAAEAFFLWRGVRPLTAPVLQALQAPQAP